MREMKLTGFSLNQDSISLDVNGQYLDVHNNYDFCGFTKDKDVVELKWRLSVGDWVPSNIPNELVIRIEGVTYFESRGDLLSIAGLDEMGFFENSTQGKVDYNGSNKPQANASVLVFRFVGGAELAVLGARAQCLAQ